MDDQRGTHAGRFGDGAKPDAESVLAELLDGRISDPGGGRQVG